MNLQSIKQRFGILGTSEQLDRALGTAARVASTDLTVLIGGQSGVGKEVFSKIIHSLSPRKHNPFIAINCGAIPGGTINSELFGHNKGAFTGASSDRKGYFETVNTGTIFLDEIAEMPMDTQAFLLRILESGEFMRVGSSKVLKTDVRIIAASNVDLLDRVRKGKFREDLYYRLNTVPIKVPSLKERPQDIHMLFRKFATDFSEKYRTESIRLDEKARLILENYGWPGNIRELKNLAEQVSVMSEDRLVTAEDLLRINPNLLSRNLPAIADASQEGNGFQEREILYKLLFDMKKDLNQLKSFVMELIQSNNLQVADSARLQDLRTTDVMLNTDYNNSSSDSPELRSFPRENPIGNGSSQHDSQPILIDPTVYDNAQTVDEPLSLADMEKEMIKKALAKFKGRRRDAATELGISERTLYRKIKDYELQ